MIGGLGLTGLRSEREFGYWLAKPAWGKGYATEAGRAFLAFLFDEAGLDIVRSGVFLDNPPRSASRRSSASSGSARA